MGTPAESLGAGVGGGSVMGAGAVGSINNAKTSSKTSFS